MGAEIFSVGTALEVPKVDFANYNREEQDAKEEKFLDDLKQLLIDHGFKGKNVGEIIRFPVADGHACYMVASMRPLRLVHIPLGDAWTFQYAKNLTAKDVQEEIDREKRWAELFKK